MLPPKRTTATAVSLRYTVTDPDAAKLNGTLDAGTFNPLPLRVETPAIQFVITPVQDDDPADKSDIHSRESFHDLAAMLGLTLYLDFPGTPSDCHKTDPQNARPAKADSSQSSSTAGIAAILTRTLQDIQSDSLIFQETVSEVPVPSIHVDGMPGATPHLLEAAYFFDHPAADCHGPVLILTRVP